MSDRLYTVVDAYDESDYYTETTDGGHEMEFRKAIVCPHPAEWDELCMRKGWNPGRFFLPVTGRIYKSRSAAIARRDLIRYWGGKAEVLVCEPVWESLDVVKKRRERERVTARIKKKQAELNALYYERDGGQAMA